MMPGSMQYLAGNMGMFSGAYTKAYMAGQESAARLKLEQMRITGLQQQQELQRNLDVYSKIFALYGDGKHPDQLIEAVTQAANNLHDQPTLQALRSLGPDAVVNLKKWLDAQYQTVVATNKQLQKQQEQEEAAETEKRRWGGEGAQRQQQTDVLGRPIGPTTTDVLGRPVAPSQGAPPALTAEAGSEAQQIVGAEPIGQQALTMFRGGDEPSGMDKDKKDEAAALAARLQSRLDAIRDSGLRGQAMMDALQKFDKPTAETLDDILHQRRDVPQRAAGGKSHPYWDTMTSLAHSVDPHWMPQQYKAKAELFDSFYQGNGRNAVRLAASAGLAQALAKFRQAVRELDPTTNIVEGAWKKWIETGEGDPRYTNLMTAWRNVVIKSTTVARGATPTVTEEKGLLDAVPLAGTKRQMLGAMQVDLSDAKINYDIAKEAWTKTLGQPLEGEHGMPYYSKEVDDTFTAVEDRMDPNTGRIEGDVPGMLQWKRLSHDPNIAKARELLKDPALAADDPRRAKIEARLQELLKAEEEPE
jgi:hypothetical protein